MHFFTKTTQLRINDDVSTVKKTQWCPHGFNRGHEKDIEEKKVKGKMKYVCERE